MKKRTILIVASVLFVALRCGAAAAEERISVSGAWALYPMMVEWAGEYQKTHKGIVIDVSAGGAGKGAADTLAGVVNIGMISREAHPDEIKQGGVFIPVAKDAVIPVINAKNPVAKSLKAHGLRKDIFIEMWMEGKSMTWGEVAGAKSKEPARVYTRSDACGAAESWAKYLGGKQEDLKGVGVYGDPGLLEAVRKDPLGAGYNNYSYVYDQKTGKMMQGVIVVPIDSNANGKVDPDEKVDTRAMLKNSIVKGVYPHPPARPLYVMTLGEPKGATRDFILWILTKGQTMIPKAGYLAIPDKDLKKQLDSLKAAKKK